MVFLGKLPNGQKVALKRMFVNNAADLQICQQGNKHHGQKHSVLTDFINTFNTGLHIFMYFVFMGQISGFVPSWIGICLVPYQLLSFSL